MYFDFQSKQQNDFALKKLPLENNRLLIEQFA